MERLTKWLNDKKNLCIKECEKECVEKYTECHKCEPFKDVMKRLAEYEDAEEYGLLLKPKVALNSFVYWDSGYWGIIPYKVCNISYSIHGFCYEICAFNGDELLDDQEVVDDDFGKYAFFTYEEAEKEITNKLQSHAEAIIDERNGR